MTAGAASEPIRVSLFDIPPYAQADEGGNLSGTFVAFFRQVQKDVAIRIETLPAARLHRDMKAGMTDCTIYIRTAATDKIAKPIMYLGLDFHTAVFSTADANVQSYDDLKTIVLGVGRGTIFGHKIDDDPDLNKFVASDYYHAARLMKAGRIDAIVGVEWSVLHNLRKIGFDLSTLPPPLILATNPLWLFCSRETQISDKQITELTSVIEALIKSGKHHVLNNPRM